MSKAFVYYVVPGTLECKRDEGWIIHELLEAFSGVGYTKERIKAAMERSVNFGIYELIDGNMIIAGFARVVSDESLFSSLMDVVIAEPKRGKGLGRQLVEEILAHPRFAKTTWVLHTTTAAGFYKKLGFKPVTTGIMAKAGSW